jgi:hypothetical protein
MLEAGDLLRMSEQQFRRCRDRHEEEGFKALRDRRIEKPYYFLTASEMRALIAIMSPRSAACWSSHISAYSPAARGRLKSETAAMSSARP